jgi:amino acid transporter
MSEESSELNYTSKGMGWRVSLSILGAVGWLVFLILWLFFYANTYVWEKNLAIIMLSIVVLCGIVGLPWAYWAMKHMSDDEKEMWRMQGFRWRVAVTLVVFLVVFGFLIYWFWYLAQPYNIYQNIAIFIVAFLIAGGLIGAMWAPWGMRHKPRLHHTETKEE